MLLVADVEINMTDRITSIFNKARLLAEEEIKSYEDEKLEKLLFKPRGQPLKRDGINTSNLIYGEVFMEDFLKIFSDENISLNLNRDLIFIDLGCGSGNILVAVYLHLIYSHSLELESHSDSQPVQRKLVRTNKTKVKGFEVLATKYLNCRVFLEYLKKLVSNDNVVSEEELPEINVVQENFLKYSSDWVSADVIYSCCTCFTSDQLVSMLDVFLNLKEGAILIMFDKDIETIILLAVEKEKESNITLDTSKSKYNTALDKFELKGCVACRTSWGTGNAFIYRKQ